MKINIEDVLIKLILIFPVTTILQVYNTFLNRVVFSIIIVLSLILLFFSLKKNKDNSIIIIFNICILLFNVTYSFYITKKPFVNFNDFLYLPFWVLFLFYLSKRSNEFIDKLNHNQIFIKCSLLLFAITIIVLLLINHNYFALGRHRMASGAFLAFVNGLLLISKNKSKSNVFLLIAPIVTIVFGFSRTYIVMLAVSILLFYYIKIKRKEMFIVKIFPLLVIVIFLILHTNIFNRFYYSQVGNFDKMGSITSGRSIFWEKDWDFFMKTAIGSKMLGLGYNAIYEVNSSVIANIYAHNDFINIMFSNGLIGLFLYLYSYFNFFKSEAKKNNLNRIYIYITMFIFFFNGFFNGEYNYPASVFSIPVLISVLVNYKQKEGENEKKDYNI